MSNIECNECNTCSFFLYSSDRICNYHLLYYLNVVNPLKRDHTAYSSFLLMILAERIFQ